jgi:bifunctional non-homologous end joining protein LigD
MYVAVRMPNRIARDACLANTSAMDSLREYRRRRPEGASPEPRGGRPTPGHNSFVVQRHDATRLHYDFRLEMNGVLKSWAVPKGPSLNPRDKRLAIQVEDHPLDYGEFEGSIPEGNYGAGEVVLWDKGTYTTEGATSPEDQLKRGELKIILHGQKLNGGFVLVRLRNSRQGSQGNGQKSEWLLIKHRDEAARTDWNIEEHRKSVKSGKPPGPPRHTKRASANAPHVTDVPNLRYAKKSPIPEELSPALATLADEPFSSDDWLYEIKWDGIRTLAFVRDGTTELMSRSGRSITSEYPEFRDLAKHVRARRAILDGEIVVLDSQGRSNFQKLQARFGVANPSAKLQSEAPVTYYFFDILYSDGYDVRGAPLIERKQLLSKLLITGDRLRISEHQIGNGLELFNAAVQNGLEGLIAKRLDSPYPEGRTSNWLKFKAVKEADAVIGGWTDPRGSRQYFGSLLVGLYEGSTLRFITGVGTGFSTALEKELFDKLQQIPSSKSPFAPVPRTRERAHWVQPKLVARIGYAEWTSDNHLRQPRFLGLQPDRDARDSTFAKEKPATAEPSSRRSSGNNAGERKHRKNAHAKPVLTIRKAHGTAVAGNRSVIDALTDNKDQVQLDLDGRELSLTHLNKIYFPKAKISKCDVLSYYATVSPYLLPFLKDRPLVLHRYPNGIAGGAFYQKEAGAYIPDWIRTVDIFSETKKQDVSYFLIDDLASLLYLTNLGCIEHNPFSARADDLEKPDYMFIDLDPTEGTSFARVMRAAKLIAEVLEHAKLKTFLKTSGATGLHIFVPIAREYGFDHIRALLEIVTRIAVDREKGLLTRIHRVRDRPKNTVFVDVRQNAYGQSLASVFSLRPREGAPVSTPITWTELKPDFRPESWNLGSVLADLPRRAKLWEKFFDHAQTLEGALAALEKSRVA